MQAEVMLFVNDVEASSRWYQRVLGLKSGHGGREYEMLIDDEKNLVFQLHHADAEEHGEHGLSDGTPRGAGVMIYLRTPDVAKAFQHARASGAKIRSEPAYIDKARHTEFVIEDPDGYALALYAR
jgi:catechol 2,3-dioxygenase-like lactoylglutathione lyase family enzyme